MHGFAVRGSVVKQGGRGKKCGAHNVIVSHNLRQVAVDFKPLPVFPPVPLLEPPLVHPVTPPAPCFSSALGSLCSCWSCFETESALKRLQSASPASVDVPQCAHATIMERVGIELVGHSASMLTCKALQVSD